MIITFLSRKFFTISKLWIFAKGKNLAVCPSKGEKFEKFRTGICSPPGTRNLQVYVERGCFRVAPIAVDLHCFWQMKTIMGIYLRIIQHYPYPSIVFRCFENKEGTETSWPRSVRWPGLVSSCFRLQLNFTFTFSFLLHQPELKEKARYFYLHIFRTVFYENFKKIRTAVKTLPSYILQIFRTVVKLSLHIFKHI